MSKLPLEGVKVCDFTWVWTGPFTTKSLADFGAEVIKIEYMNRPDVWRIQPPFKDDQPGPDRGLVFNTINTSKKSISMDISTVEGKELAKKLIAWADVVTDNYAGGAIKRMGLSYEVVKEINPDVIMMSSALMGQTGPWHDSPGYGDQLSAISGLHEISGWPDRIPGEIGFYTDFIAPRYNAMTIMAALDYRRRTGKGQYLDMAQHQGGVHYIAPLLMDYVVNGRIATREGNKDDYAAPHGFYKSKGEERWLAIAVASEDEWLSMIEVMGSPDWAKDEKFSTLAKRKENEDELDKLVDAWTQTLGDREAQDKLQAAGVPAGILNDAKDHIDDDPHLKARNYYVEREHPEVGIYHPPRQACILSKSPCDVKRAPLYGEHNEYVLKDILGLKDEDIEMLIINEVIQ
jgi:benzylsuccinate CoA-transferase BbsF subunit